MSIFDNMTSPAAVGGMFQEGFKRGRIESALAKFGKDPTSSAPIGALMSVAPEMALKLRSYQRDEVKNQRDEDFRSALGGYMRSQGKRPVPQSTVPGLPTMAEAQVARGEPMLAGNGVARSDVPAAYRRGDGGPSPLPPQGQDGQPASLPEMIVPDPSQPPAPHVLGTPESDADRYFLQMLEQDPAKAMEIDSKLRDNALSRLKTMDSAYDFAIARLANVGDDVGYQQVLGEMDARLAPLGTNIRESVPAQFPGKDGIRKLLMTALDAKDQLNAMVSRERLEAYVGDIEDDNERADRNTDSVIQDRSTRTGIARDRVAQSGKNAEQRDATTRRGQDMRPPPRSGKGGRENIPTVNSPAEAMKLPSGTKFKTPDGQIKVRP